MATKRKRELAPDHECTNCGGPVKSRRPSESGLHFCSKRECVNAKQRMLRARRIGPPAAVQAKVALAALIADAMQPNLFRSCDTCGADRVLAGWVHRKFGAPLEPCWGVGAQGADLGDMRSTALDAVMPHLAPGSTPPPAPPVEPPVSPVEPAAQPGPSAPPF